MNAATTQQPSLEPAFAIRRSAERGHGDHGWLDSWHTFSFAGYYDSQHMGFGHLRVINEDRVKAGAGFGTHGHRNMEIISYPVSGELAHKDSTGSGGSIRSGEVQVMSAGRGITHSEMNGSSTEGVQFLQIWIEPERSGTEPGYAERDFGRAPGLTLLVSPNGRDGSLSIKQDMDLFRALLNAGGKANIQLKRAKAWVQVVEGEVEVLGQRLEAGDGLAIEGAAGLDLLTQTGAEALVFDLL